MKELINFNHLSTELAAELERMKTTGLLDNDVSRILKIMFDQIDEIRNVKKNPHDREAVEAKKAILASISTYGAGILFKAGLAIKDPETGTYTPVKVTRQGFESYPFTHCVSNEPLPISKKDPSQTKKKKVTRKEVKKLPFNTD